MHVVIKRTITGISLILLFLFSFFCLPPYFFSFLLFAILLCILLCEWPQLFDWRKQAFWFLMPFYPVLPFILLILMNQNPDYRNLLFILFILIAAFDTGSYCTGMLIGRHNIAPTISPAKTWEGFAGGYFFALIGLLLVIWKSNSSPSFSFIMIFTLVTCILALCGDLFESSLKRRVGIKDSGTILPGHGGFLDRFDGILLTVFFFYVFKNYFVTILG